MANAYCDRLGIPVPRQLQLASLRDTNYLDILIVALLERGGPMTMDEIMEAVQPCWANSSERMRMSLTKAWAGRQPVVKDAEGRYALDLDSRSMNAFLIRLGLRAGTPVPRPPPFVPPGPEVPLTHHELRACFARGCPSGVSGARLAAAVLDVVGHPMLPHEVVAVGEGLRVGSLPEPQASPSRKVAGLVIQGEDGRLALNPAATAELGAMRKRIRELALPRTRVQAERAWYREHEKRLEEERAAKLAARLVAAPPQPNPVKPSKTAWRGTVVSVQPRIRMTRSYDQRSHTYLGYVLRIQGVFGDEAREFVVAVGPAAHEKHQFRIDDEVSGEGWPVEDPHLETADVYKVSALGVWARGPTERSTRPPFTGVPPTLEEYRARGHRRLAALTYRAKCTTCLWGCEMAVEMIIDQWNPSKRRYRRETFCYGPKACRLYAAGPARKVPGRKGMSWTEADWVDQDATSHRREEE